MKGTDYLLRSLVADGIDHLFMMTGGLVDPFYAAVAGVPEITPVVAAHEGGAVFMADGYARAGGRFGACLCIGGPGLTNTVTGVSAAYTDESPVLVLTGAVANYMQDLGLFQDATAATYHDVDILAPVTAESYSVPDVRLLHHAYRRAVNQMLDGKRQPVHLTVPRDVQEAGIDVEPAGGVADLLASAPLDREAASVLWGKVKEAPRIVMLVGGGTIADNAGADLIAAAERFEIPVATTQHAKGTFPENHPLSLGVFGYAGTRHATQAILHDDLDLLIVLGAAFNARDTDYYSTRLAPKRGILSVDLSSVELRRTYADEQFVRGHGGAFARWLATVPDPIAEGLINTMAEREAWVKDIREGPRLYDVENTTSDAMPIHPARMITEARAAMPPETIAIVDSGAHRAFAVHYWESYGPRQYLTASSLGPMGWAIGAGIGAKAAVPDAPVIVFTGDGCMRMHGVEVQTAARFDLPVIYCVSNNQALGNVWLRAVKQGPIPAMLNQAPDHDFAAFGRALGTEGITVNDPDELAGAFATALDLGKTVVIDVKTDRTATTPVEPYHEGLEAWSYHE
jgi:acetolactate synthase I/II/III large subunit